MAARRSRARGRYWVAFWLATFLAVAAIVLIRQRAGFDTAGRLRTLKERRGSLEAQAAAYNRRIGVGKTAEALAPKVARLGLYPAPDSATTTLKIVGAGER